MRAPHSDGALSNRRPSAAQVLLSVLADMDQDAPRGPVEAHVDALGSTFLLRHRDDDVRLYTACCLSDVLRLYAPEPPFSHAVVKDVLALFVKQLGRLNRPQSPQYPKTVYLLQNLAEVKAFVMAFDFGAGEQLPHLFSSLFAALAVPHETDTYATVVSMMQGVLENADAVEDDLLGAVCAELAGPGRSATAAPLAAARTLLERTLPVVQPAIRQYLQLLFADAGSTDLPEGSMAPHAHELVLELAAVHPDLLLSAMPMLQQELRVEAADSRAAMVALVGRMFAARGGELLLHRHGPLWHEFVGRAVDADVAVRAAVAAGLGAVLGAHGRLAAVHTTANAQLVGLCTDDSPRVRLAGLEAVCAVAEQGGAALEPATVAAVLERLKDRRPQVRSAAATKLAAIFRRQTLLEAGMPADGEGDADSAEDSPPAAGAWDAGANDLRMVPARLIAALGVAPVAETEAVHALLRAVASCIPETLPCSARSQLLGAAVGALDERGRSAFRFVLRGARRARRTLAACLAEHEAGTLATGSPALAEAATWVSSRGCPGAESSIVTAIAAAEVAGALPQLATCLADVPPPAEDYAEALAAVHAATRSTRDFAGLLSFTLGLPALDQPTAAAALESATLSPWVADAAEFLPGLFAGGAALAACVSAIRSPPAADVVPLIALFAHAVPQQAATPLVAPLQRLAGGEGGGSFAATATKALVGLQGPKAAKALAAVVKHHAAEVDGLQDDGTVDFEAAAAAFGALASVEEAAPAEGESAAAPLRVSMMAAAEAVLSAPVPEVEEDAAEWSVHDSDAPVAAIAKAEAVRYLGASLSAAMRGAAPAILERGLRLLFRALAADGELVHEARGSSGPEACARVRAASASALLSLALHPGAFRRLFKPADCTVLCASLQDGCPQVRERMSQRFNALRGRRLPAELVAGLVFAVTDPEPKLAARAISTLRAHVARIREAHRLAPAREQPAARLLASAVHMLAHHADLLDAGPFPARGPLGREQLAAIHDCRGNLEPLLAALGDAELPMLRGVARHMRTAVDAQVPSASAPMQLVAELALMMVDERFRAAGRVPSDAANAKVAPVLRGLCSVAAAGAPWAPRLGGNRSGGAGAGAKRPKGGGRRRERPAKVARPEAAPTRAVPHRTAKSQVTPMLEGASESEGEESEDEESEAGASASNAKPWGPNAASSPRPLGDRNRSGAAAARAKRAPAGGRVADEDDEDWEDEEDEPPRITRRLVKASRT